MIHALRVAHSIIRQAVKRLRSPKWRAVEKAHLRNNPACEACGSVRRTQVHHIQPFHLHPELELEPSNLISLCMDTAEDHLVLGHSGSWRAWNPDVIRCAELARQGLSTMARRRAALAKRVR